MTFNKGKICKNSHIDIYYEALRSEPYYDECRDICKSCGEDLTACVIFLPKEEKISEHNKPQFIRMILHR